MTDVTITLSSDDWLLVVRHLRLHRLSLLTEADREGPERGLYRAWLREQAEFVKDYADTIQGKVWAADLSQLISEDPPKTVRHASEGFSRANGRDL